MIKYETKNFIRFYEGELPIILSAPHGGDQKPSSIKNRTDGVFDKDDFTIELTQLIIEEFKTLTNKIPYAIISEISREKVDINRKPSEAYEDEKAKIVYDEFHNLIKSSEKKVERDFKKGIYIDIHGQSHPKGYLEFGYLLDNSILKLPDINLREFQSKSSIKTLSKFSKESFIDQIKGPHSMGSLMCNDGFDSVPSIKLPYATDDNYFEGAYDTIRYGSLDGSNISGIQIEFPYLNCRDTQENRKRCAKVFVKSLIKFIEIHLDIKL